MNSLFKQRAENLGYSVQVEPDGSTLLNEQFWLRENGWSPREGSQYRLIPSPDKFIGISISVNSEYLKNNFKGIPEQEALLLFCKQFNFIFKQD